MPGKRIATPKKSSSSKDFFLAQKLAYATTTLPTGVDPLEEFLFETRRGNCEFFASSFALLLRVAGIPSRLVGGYYGGTYNDFGGYYIITEDMAHVWVEAFLPGKGWITIDPSRFATNFSGSRGHRNRGLTERLSMTMDAFNYYWNRTVINYDLERQLRLLSRADLEVKRMHMPFDLKGRLRLVVLSASLLTAIAWLRRRAGASAEERVLARFFKRVRQEYDLEQVAGTGLLEFAARLDDPNAVRFAALYSGVVYRDRSLTSDEIKLLKQYIRQIRNPEHMPLP